MRTCPSMIYWPLSIDFVADFSGAWNHSVHLELYDCSICTRNGLDERLVKSDPSREPMKLINLRFPWYRSHSVYHTAGYEGKILPNMCDLPWPYPQDLPYVPTVLHTARFMDYPLAGYSRKSSAVWLLTRYERCPNLVFGIDWNKDFPAKSKVDSHPGNTPLLACQTTFGVLSPWESALHVADFFLFQSIPEWSSVNNAARASYCLISCGKSPIWMLISRHFDASSHGARTVTGRAFRTTTQDWKADLAIYSPP